MIIFFFYKEWIIVFSKNLFGKIIVNMNHFWNKRNNINSKNLKEANNDKLHILTCLRIQNMYTYFEKKILTLKM